LPFSLTTTRDRQPVAERAIHAERNRTLTSFSRSACLPICSRRRRSAFA